MAHSDEERKALGKRLTAARKVAGYPSLQAVADKFTELGYPIGKAAVGHWETGRNIPDAIWLRRLAKLYDTTLDALVWDRSISIEAIQMAAEFDSLSSEKQVLLKALWATFIAKASATEKKRP